MRISSNTFNPITMTGIVKLATVLDVPPRSTVPVPLQDTLQISEIAQQKISQIQQGNESLQQAITQSRQAARTAAQERISSAKEYLKILMRLSPAGDEGAAHEAARIAREVKSSAIEFKKNSASGDGINVRSEIDGFTGVAGDVLKMARSLIESYLLQKRTNKQMGDNDLKKDIRDAVSTLRKMSNETIIPEESNTPTDQSIPPITAAL